MEESPSLFERMIGRSRPVWVTLLASTLLLALPFAAVLLDGALGEMLQEGQWRVLLLPSVIIIYIILVSPLMMHMGEQVLEALRPLVQLDDDAFDNMVRKAAHINPVHELLVFGAGFALGILSATASSMDGGLTWLRIYWLLAMGLMYAILGWTIYVSVISTRVNAAIHRQPLQFDILDPTPFEAVGRQSLLLALVFVGGITLSLLLSFQIENMTTPAFWLINLLLVLLVVLIFFLNMRPT
ncbi:MAG: hypothetical protein U9R58_15260, partial [Chloroflexota bacterium]|nr:hypothetical protein [Chloroflexota bacterium]